MYFSAATVLALSLQGYFKGRMPMLIPQFRHGMLWNTAMACTHLRAPWKQGINCKHVMTNPRPGTQSISHQALGFIPPIHKQGGNFLRCLWICLPALPLVAGAAIAGRQHPRDISRIGVAIQSNEYRDGVWLWDTACQHMYSCLDSHHMRIHQRLQMQYRSVPTIHRHRAPVIDEVRKLIELAQAPPGKRRPAACTNRGGVVVQLLRISQEEVQSQKHKQKGRQKQISDGHLPARSTRPPPCQLEFQTAQAFEPFERLRCGFYQHC